MILFTQSTAVSRKYLNAELKNNTLLHFSPRLPVFSGLVLSCILFYMCILPSFRHFTSSLFLLFRFYSNNLVLPLGIIKDRLID